MAVGQYGYVTTHDPVERWPPTVAARAGWADRYPLEAGGLDVIVGLDAAIAWTNDLVASIDSA